ncbi:MAG: glycine zipper 2TM domain-containing protein [Candidatus Hydrogenedentes bacterium]|nr:glycine zipper 2TM domain-containing protein [Candidatus Hydrogenedentota bacterium]
MNKMHGILAGMAVAGLAIILIAGCQTTPVQDGAVLGGALGAATGAIIGHQSGQQGEGALIGAGVGALTGAIVGDQVDEHQARHGEGRYNTYQPVQAAPAPAPVANGRYETVLRQAPNGEYYEDRVWVRN